METELNIFQKIVKPLLFLRIKYRSGAKQWLRFLLGFTRSGHLKLKGKAWTHVSSSPHFPFPCQELSRERQGAAETKLAINLLDTDQEKLKTKEEIHNTQAFPSKYIEFFL